MSEEIINVQSDVKSLEIYDRINDPMLAIKTLGAAIFKSGIFYGLDRPEQGEVLAMECLAQRKSPLELVRTFHFINGQLTIRADALLAKFHQAGGSVTWHERTDKIVRATFKRGESAIEITHTFQAYVDNKVAIGKDGKVKDNWAKWPIRMLTARAISEGVRLIAPECCFGTYVSEEMDSPSKPTITKTLDDLIPPRCRDAAVRVLIKSGHLEEGQGWGDIPPDFIESIQGRRQLPFIEAVHAEFYKN